MEEFVQMDYVRRIMAEIDERSQQRTAINNAEEQGLKKGLAKGLAKGKAEVAKAMKEKGLPAEMICEVTGLSRESVEAL